MVIRGAVTLFVAPIGRACPHRIAYRLADPAQAERDCRLAGVNPTRARCPPLALTYAVLCRCDSLPPCGGGLGWGVVPRGTASLHSATPTPNPSPQGGGEESAAPLQRKRARSTCPRSAADAFGRRDACCPPRQTPLYLAALKLRPSSSGPGLRPFTAETRVRFP